MMSSGCRLLGVLTPLVVGGVVVRPTRTVVSNLIYGGVKCTTQNIMIRFTKC